MVRAPCCEKMGLKKGPWTLEEDRILISYIQRYGHENWRALPKQAGLLRCGKSCRLRWINYLRPDIKRGNFSREEEDAIIKLHEKLGNRWSAIAAKLPGRTDNEIKNVWHTHLKKRLKQNQGTQEINNQSSIEISNYEINTSRELKPINFPTYLNLENSGEQSSSENSSETESSVLTYETHHKGINEQIFNSTGNVPEINEDLWSEELFEEISCIKGDFPADYCLNTGEEMDFWFNVFIQAEDLPEMPEF